MQYDTLFVYKRLNFHHQKIYLREGRFFVTK